MKVGSMMVMAILTSGAMALAQDVPTTAPATMPATLPAVVADSTTPQGTLVMLSRATDSGDIASVRSLFSASNPEEQKLADALLRRTEVYARFRQAATKAFGADAARDLTGTGPDEAADNERRIAAADVKIDNNDATIHMDGQADPVKLIKVDGQWKLAVGTLIEGMNNDDVDKRLGLMNTVADVVKETSDEITKGKYKTAAEVNDAIQGKLETATLKAAAAASQPATTEPAPGAPAMTP